MKRREMSAIVGFGSKARSLGVFLVSALMLGLLPAHAYTAPMPNLTVADVTVTEGDSGLTAAAFIVKLSRTPSKPVSFKFETQDGTAVAPADYAAMPKTDFSIPAGQTSLAVTVNVVGETAIEGAEDFGGLVTQITNAKVADGTATATIVNDDFPPTISIGDAVVTEGDSSSKDAVFTASLSKVAASAVTVDYRTIAGTAGSGTDITLRSGSLTIPSGAVSRTVAVPVLGDLIDENDENFTVVIENPVGATLSDGSGTGTVIDNDAAPVVSISDTVVTEPLAGSSDAVFIVRLSHPSASSTSVAYQTAPGSATSPQDFASKVGTLSFAAGEITKQITVSVASDLISENPDETFTVTLSNPTGLTLGRSTATATIDDDDPLPKVSVADTSVIEGDEGQRDAVFDVSLSGSSSTPIVVTLTTSDGSSLVDLDYVATTLELTFSPGQRTKSFAVPVQGDVIDEPDTTFNVRASVVGPASLGDVDGIATVIDDDATPQISIGDVTKRELNAGSSQALLPVTLSGPSETPITVSYAAEALAPASSIDFSAPAGSITFAPLSTTAEMVVSVTGDKMVETNEQVSVSLSSPVAADLNDGSATVTITDDDTALTFRAKKTTSAIRASGLLKPGLAGRTVVKLFKKRSGKWALVSTKKPLLRSATDPDGDGITQAAYATTFKRPSARYCKFMVTYGGNSSYGASKVTRLFRC